jgi:hypothetical protein
MAGKPKDVPAADQTPERVRCGGWVLTENGWQIDEPATDAPTT